MLTAELVRARRRGDELQLAKFDEQTAERARDLAALILGIARDHVGRTRDELEQALRDVEPEPRDRLLGLGLKKLVDDRCAFLAPEGDEAADIRKSVFLRAAEIRKRDGAVDRDAILAELGAERGKDAAQMLALLHADLPGAHLLESVLPGSAEDLVAGYPLAEVQAVLLRATRVEARITLENAGAARALFRKLKFLRLLPTIEKEGNSAYKIALEGPYSLFESVTKYGLALALVVPALEEAGPYELTAELRWGPEKRPLKFTHRGGGARIAAMGDRLPPFLEDLRRTFDGLGSGWRVTAARSLLTVAGVGVVVPDLVFEHAATKRKAHLEVLGFWSREAVFRRVDLARAGLKDPIVFAVSERLRVSEELLGDDDHAALYVYKGALNARRVLEKIEGLVASDRTL